MRHYSGLLSFSLIVVGAGILPLINRGAVSALGCDTYYRVTGEIAGCTDISTDRIREAWLDRYSRVCLEQQLAADVSLYESQFSTYFANWQSENSDRELKFDRLPEQNLEISSPTLSTETYQGNDDFCDR
ncbi:MAG: hypothetical protein AAFR63_14225 [Cyanobacteria bacterium J06631_6]